MSNIPNPILGASHAFAAEISQPLFDAARSRSFRTSKVRSEFHVPVVLFDRDYGAIQVLRHSGT
jgi:hypothetical protein